MPNRTAARRQLPWLIAIVAVLTVACGSAAPAQPSPSPVTPSAAVPTYAPIGQPAPATPRPSVLFTPAPSAPAPVADLPRHGRIELAAYGFAVTLPANWYRIDLTQDDLASFLQAGTKAVDPSASTQLANEVAALAASHISLFALRFPDAKAGTGTNLNILALPTLGLDLDALEKLNLAQLASLLGKGTKIAHQRITLPAGPALRLSYQLSSPAQPKVHLGTLQTLIVAGGQQYILTCSAPGSVTKIAPECDGMAKSLEILP
jgi:hypothetical protein